MDTSTNAYGVFSPPGSKTHPQFIRFIDTEYRELFKIPDGANIKVTYPPGDLRGFAVRECRYIDDHHFRVIGNGSDTYHIAEFAGVMERIGAKYEPQIQLRNAELLPFTPGEENFYTYNREEGNACVGHISGDFGHNGDRFHTGWNNHITKNESDWENTTPEFRAELYQAVYALRQEVLKDRDTMLAYCNNHPEAVLPSTGDIYGFKLETDTRQYYLRCSTERDSRFIIYAYETPAPALELLPGTTDDHAMFYQPKKDSLYPMYRVFPTLSPWFIIPRSPARHSTARV